MSAGTADDAPGRDPTAPERVRRARRFRWRRRVLLAGIALVLLLAVLPTLAGPFLRVVVERRLARELEARVELRELGLSWPGRLVLRGLELAEPDGGTLASLDELSIELQPLALLGGRIVGRAHLGHPELHLRRDPQGRWNWEHTLDRIASASAASSEREAGTPARLPELEAELELLDGLLVVHGGRGETRLSAVRLTASSRGLDQPLPFELGLDLLGPAGAAGHVALTGSLRTDARGSLEPADLGGRLELHVQELDLAALEPALALVAPLRALEGGAGGSAQFTLEPGLLLSGSGSLALERLSVSGPRKEAPPARIERLTLEARAEERGAAGGEQHLELRAEPFLHLSYAGRSELSLGTGSGTLSGHLDLAGDLGPLTELARPWVPVQPGVRLGGQLDERVELSATLVDGRPQAFELSSRGGFEGLAATDAGGRHVDLEALKPLGLELDLGVDLESGTGRVGRLALNAGPLLLTGQLEATGLALGAAAGAPAPLPRVTGALDFSADLGLLHAALARVLELEELSFGGQARGRLELGTAADATLSLEGRLDAEQLVLTSAPGSSTRLQSLHAELHGRRQATGDLGANGSLQLGALEWEQVGPEGSRSAATRGAGLSWNLQRSAGGKSELSLGVETRDQAVRCTLQGRGLSDASGDESWTLSYKVEGRIGDLADLAQPWLEPGPLSRPQGDLLAQGQLDLTLHEDRPRDARLGLQAFLTRLALRELDGTSRPLGEFARTTLGLEATLDPVLGTLELASLDLSSGPLRFSGSARASGLPRLAGDGDAAHAGAPSLDRSQFVLDLDLERAGPELSAWLGPDGARLDGGPLHAEFALTGGSARVTAAGSLRGEGLRLQRAGATPLEQRELAADFDLTLEPEPGTLELRRCELASDAGRLKASGRVADLRLGTRARGELVLSGTGSLQRLMSDLGLEAPGSGRETSGALAGSLTLKGDEGALRFDGQATITDFRLQVSEAQGAPLRLEEPRIVLTGLGGLTLPEGNLELERIQLESGMLRGGASGRIEGLGAWLSPAGGELAFQGCAGELAYVPDRLGAVLGPWLPGELSGSEEERVTFSLDGRARELDLAALLAGGKGSAQLGLGHFARPELQLAGRLGLEFTPGRVNLKGDLGANGGELKLDGVLDLAPPAGVDAPAAGPASRSHLGIEARGLRANSGLAPLLSQLHPAFASIDATQGTLDGILGLDLDLTYDGALTLEQLQGGWEQLPKQPVNGSGRLELRQASLKGSPLLELLRGFGVDTQRTLDLRPLEFSIRKGRVHYDRPWTWTLSGTETTFTGSLGLDRSLDLSWNVPIGDGLVKRWSFLESMRGQTLSLPLRGTLDRPRLESDELLRDLATQVARSELESRLGLGGGAEDPARLLEQADRLWNEGKKAEAAPIYKRLRDDFQLSLVYVLNKSRIRDRAKFEPPR